MTSCLTTCVGHEDQLFTTEKLSQCQLASSVQSFVYFSGILHHIEGDRNFGIGICRFESLGSGVSLSANPGNLFRSVSESSAALKCFLDRGFSTFFRTLTILWFCGATPFVFIVWPRKSTFWTPKWLLAMLSLRPAFLRHWKTARVFLINCLGVLAAMPQSSTPCAHLSALMTGSRYSRTKLAKTDRQRLSPSVNLRFAIVLVAN